MPDDLLVVHPYFEAVALQNPSLIQGASVSVWEGPGLLFLPPSTATVKNHSLVLELFLRLASLPRLGELP